MEILPFLAVPKGITAIIGGGGKTTLMTTLAEELKEKGTVVFCTSTHIRIPEDYPLITGEADAIREGISRGGVVCAGRIDKDHKVTAPGLSFRELEGLADYILVEADGSKGLPLKAHASHEPVIPEEAKLTILVVGADGFDKPVKEVCHRPELWAGIAGVSVDDMVTPASCAKVVRKEGFGDILFVNKAESERETADAAELAGYLEMPVVMGSLRNRNYRRLSYRREEKGLCL